MSKRTILSQREIARNTARLCADDQPVETNQPEGVVVDAVASCFKQPNIAYIPPHIQRMLRTKGVSPPSTRRELRRLLFGEAAPTNNLASRRQAKPRCIPAYG